MTLKDATYIGFKDGIFDLFSKVKDDDHTAYLRESLNQFVDFNTTDNAFAVMDSFFDLYFERNEKNPLTDMVGMLKTYEEQAASLTDSQRDHYIHMVNVFVLGICIYASNPKVMKAFSDKGQNQEEFLFSWGIASLLHDIGYPAEIVNNQAKRFFDAIQGSVPKEDRATPILCVHSQNKLWTLPSNEVSNNDLLSQVSSAIVDSFRLDGEHINDMIHKYMLCMENKEFIDHGFYSMIMFLRWRSETPLLPRAPKGCKVGEQAAAILLHNYYGRVLIDNQMVGPMHISDFPLAYLLILCDELQEWNRRSYGKKGTPILPDNASVRFYENGMHIEYKTKSANMANDFPLRKKAKLYELLNVDEVFQHKIEIFCTCDIVADLALKEVSEDVHIPRLLAVNIERLAASIHNEYNRNRLIEKPGEPLEYPSWDSLSQQMKYSNIRQARAIPDKLWSVGFILSDDPNAWGRVKEFTPKDREFLAKQEHDLWVEERVANGWIYGKNKDVINKISPYVASWEDIPPEVQNYDFETVDFIIPAVEAIGMYVCRPTSP